MGCNEDGALAGGASHALNRLRNNGCYLCTQAVSSWERNAFLVLEDLQRQ